MKTRKMTGLLCAAVIIGMASSSSAATRRWNGSTGNTLWSDASNWNTLPAAADNASFRPGDMGANNIVTLDSAVGASLFAGEPGSTLTVNMSAGGTAALQRIFLGDDRGTAGSAGTGHLNVTGGTMNIEKSGGATTFIAVGAEKTGTGTFTMSGGTINIGQLGTSGPGSLKVAEKVDTTGTFTMTAGTINADQFKIAAAGATNANATVSISGGLLTFDAAVVADGTTSGSTVSLDLSGGKVAAATLNLSFDGDDSFTVGNGLFELAASTNDLVSTIQGYVDNGWITELGSTGGADVSSYTFSGGLSSDGNLRWGEADSGETVLYAIPEPATFSMIGLLGGALFWIRRRFII